MYQVPHDPHGNDLSTRAWLRDLGFLGLIGVILMAGIVFALGFAVRLGLVAGLVALIGVVAGCVSLARVYARRKNLRQSLVVLWLISFIVAVTLVSVGVDIFTQLP